MEPVPVHLISHQNSSLLRSIAPDVFDHAVQPALLQEFLGNPMNHIAVAVLDGSVVGMVSAITYVHPDKPLQMFINELGVASTHRRLGIGRQLMEFMLAHAKRLGCTEAWIGTEVDNEAALALYQTTGSPIQEQAVIFTYEFEQQS